MTTVTELFEREIQYIHLRKQTESGGISNRGGKTIAFIELNGKICYAESYCNPKENYCKRLGREITKGRLIQNKYQMVQCTEDQFRNTMALSGALTKR